MTPYQPPQPNTEITLRLHANETVPAAAVPREAWAPTTIGHYPDFTRLQQCIGRHWNLDPARIVVTAGGDEGIDRVMRWSRRGARREVLSHTPGFPMIAVYCQNSGGLLREEPWWQGPFPTSQFSAQINDQTALVVLVTPNNPTGQAIPIDDQLTVARESQKRGAWTLIDLAYVEFADDDPTRRLAELPQVVLVRTLSKAWGLAGLRVGYLIAPDRQTANELRNLSGPFPISGPSLAIAEKAFDSGLAAMQHTVATVRHRRGELSALIRACGGEPLESQGNFVLARWPDAERIWRRLADQGIGVRWFGGQHGVSAEWLRISCPTHDLDLQRLAGALHHAIGNNECAPATRETDRDGNATNCNVGAAAWQRATRETAIDVVVQLYGSGKHSIHTGLGFLDHMLAALSCHSRIDIELRCRGDLHVDDHHSVEDCALALGECLNRALGDRTGIERFGTAYAPLDESLARCVVDLSGRPWSEVHLGLLRERLGDVASENLTHFFQSLAVILRAAVHIDVLRGANDHHRAEAAFKALALALRQAIRRAGEGVPSTKGVI